MYSEVKAAQLLLTSKQLKILDALQGLAIVKSNLDVFPKLFRKTLLHFKFPCELTPFKRTVTR